MKLEDLKNIRTMLNRVPVTGPESIAWCQAAAALEAEIAGLAPPKQPAPQ